MNYTDVTQVFDLLESTDGLIQITPVHLSGFVSRTSTINADGDIAPGAVNTADIQFSVLDIRGPVSSYTGREFVYRKGYAEAATREKMTTAADAYVTRAGVEYYIYGTTLTATDGVTTNTYTVTKGAGALVLLGAELIVLYPDEPYAQRFTVDGTTLTDLGTPLFVYDYDQEIAAGYARQQVSYAVDNDTVTAYHAFKMFNVRYLDTTVYEVHTVGYFTFDRPKRGTGDVYTVSASDRMTAFDSDYIDVLNSATTGTTAQQLLESLCSAAGVELAAQDRYNADLVIVVPEDLESCTGIQMLTWLGEIMSCSWRINAAGQLESVWFAQTATRLTKDDYVSFSYEAYMVAPIDKVLTGSAYADVVGFAGSGANALVIDQNSLLSYTEQEDLNQFSSGLLTQVATVPEYRPGTLSGYANPTINPGDVIYVDNDDDEMEPVCVTQITESGFQLTITSSGNPRREVQNYASASLQAIKRTVDQLREQTGAFPDQWAQDIENTVKSITGAMGGTRVDLFNPDTGLPSGTAYCLDGDGLATAKNVLVINAGGIAFYDNGFDADNPEASVPAYVVMNNQGQVDASSILTGILTAIIIKSADGESFYADLQNGIIRIKASEFTISGKTVDEYSAVSSNSANMLENPTFENWTSGGGDKLSYVVEDGVLKVAFDEADQLDTYMYQDVVESMMQLAQGKCMTISFDYKVITPFADVASMRAKMVWTYEDGYQDTLYYKERNGALKYDEASEDWIHYEKSYTTQVNPREISRLGMQVSFTWLDDVQKHGGEVHFKNWRVSVTPLVQTDNTRQSFANDDSNVSISSGQITFTANTLVVDSNNFKLDKTGNVSITGEFHSTDGTSVVDIKNGVFRITRKLDDGSYQEAATLAASGSNASIGNLYLLGPKADGSGQTYNVTAFSSYSGGNFCVYNAAGQIRFQAVINGDGDAEVWVNGSRKF